MSDDQYETNSGGFSKARSHIMLILGLVVAATIAIWLERLDPQACRRVEIKSPPRLAAAPVSPA